MDDLRTWSDLRRAIESRPRGAQSHMADFMGVDRSQFSRQLKTNKDLTVSELENARDFLSGNEAPDGEEGAPRPQRGPAAYPSRTRLPVYGYAAASDGDRFVLNEGHVLEERELPMGVTLGPGEYFIVLPSGTSMEPRIVAGEPQVVRRKYPPSRDKSAVVEFKDGTAVIKNFKGWRDDRLFVEQFNPPKVLDYARKDIEAVHAVIFSF